MFESSPCWVGHMTAEFKDALARKNDLMARLPEREFGRIAPHLERVKLPLGEVIYEPNTKIPYAYFPTTAIVSLLYVLEDGSSAEIAIVGNDGMVGIALFMGGWTTSNQALVQSAGEGYRLPADLMFQEFNRSGPMKESLLLFTQCLITQMAQTSVCNRHHSIDQQLCRWLLLSIDRLPSSELRMTQDMIANMLGVRREGVTVAAGALEAAGLIKYSRGRIRVIDRPGLEARVCECYEVVRTEIARIMQRGSSGVG
jgi:CRP-like cAMP-binding protein